MTHLRNFLEKILPARELARARSLYHFLLAFLAALWCGFPARKLKVIGVTGTKGKTTTVEILHEVLAQSGAKTASLSTVRFKIRDQETPNDLKMTMPGRFFVQRFLRDAKKAGCGYAVLEVTSQGIAQYRHRFISFHAAVMTNMAPEHLEAHGGFENYLRTKLDLFYRLKKTAVAIINRDDPSWPRFTAATGARILSYSKEKITRGNEEWVVGDCAIKPDGISFLCAGARVESRLLGEFNFYNILAAFSVGLAEHMAPEKISSAIGRVSGVSGRMEYVCREPFSAVVDYAHTPDSLKNVYAFLKKSGAKGKLICVLGATGGGRDTWKRPEFGRIAEEFCDRVFLTNEDPYDEDPQAIIDQIAVGFSSAQKFQKILDRRAAIRAALQSASLGDTVVITGKGGEPWIMGPNATKIPWDDRAVVREEMNKLKK